MSNETGLYDIAVIGLNGRFPASKDIFTFQDNLRRGVNCIHYFSKNELIRLGLDKSKLENPFYVKATSMFPEPECFDSSFFRYSPKEARLIDPQQRCFLECAWQAIEHAGYGSVAQEKSVGVFAGESSNMYLLDNFNNNRLDMDLDFMNHLEYYINGEKDFLATRVSYKLNLTGPSFTVQSACSTSLVAVHLACKSLLMGECDMALAGAVTVRLPSAAGYWYKPGGMASPDGFCRAFSADAQGTVFGSGVGILVLKRLSDALEDGDYIWSVIKSTAINNDGATKLNYSAPSLDKQSDVILAALAQADINPETISYIEAHGTGTPLGDPVEVAALTQAFREYTEKKQFCALGSVKTNIGHLDAASGMAGLIKTILSLHSKELYPHLHFNKPNPKIDFINSPFYVNTSLTAWKKNNSLLRAGVTALGVGGTNAHVILEEPPTARSRSKKTSSRYVLVPLSAKAPEVLESQIHNLKGYLEANPLLELEDVAYTLQTGRHHFEERQFFLMKDIHDSLNVIRETTHDCILDKQLNLIIPHNNQCDLNILDSLLGAEPYFYEQYNASFNMAKEIANTTIDFDSSAQVFLKNMISNNKSPEPMTELIISVSAVYALGMFLLNNLIKPNAIFAQGNGELVAACLTGLISLRNMWELLLFPNSKQTTTQTQMRSFYPLYISSQDEWIVEQSEVISDYWNKVTASDNNLEQFQAQLDIADSEGTCSFILLSISVNTYSKFTPFGIFYWYTQLQDGYAALLACIGSLWRSGVSIQWGLLDNKTSFQHVPLPAYPFKRERYRLPNRIAAAKSDVPINPGGRALLIKHFKNYPALEKTIYETTLGLSNYSYLSDHKVYDLLIIPAALHISMALSAAVIHMKQEQVVLTDLLFSQALFISTLQSRTVQLIVDTSQTIECSYALVSYPAGQEEDASVLIKNSSGKIQFMRELLPVHLSFFDIQKRCIHEYMPEDLYKNGLISGFDWGKKFQCVKKLWRGENEVLALIEHHSSVISEIAQYSLHPTILDSCFQPYMELLPGLEQEDGAYIPISIDRIGFFKKSTATLWSHIRLHSVDGLTRQSVETYTIDVTLFDDEKEIICQIEGLHLKHAPKSVLVHSFQESMMQNTLFIPEWKPISFPALAQPQPKSIVIVGRLEDYLVFSAVLTQLGKTVSIYRIVLHDHYDETNPIEIQINSQLITNYQQALAKFSFDALYFLDGTSYLEADNEKFYEQKISVLSFFRLIRTLMNTQYSDDVYLNVLTAGVNSVTPMNEGKNPYAGALIGMAKVIAREMPQFKVACLDVSHKDLIDLSEDLSWNELLINTFWAAQRSPNVPEMALRGREHFIKKLRPFPPNNQKKEPFKKRGTYLITGGARGVGFVIAQYLAQTYQASLILIGRKPSSQYSDAIASLQATATSVLYFQADVSNAEEIKKVIANVQKTGVINGVINCAAVLADRPLTRMTEDEFLQAFLPKAQGLNALYKALQDIPIDFLVSFSSENSFRGNAGQANYVAGCIFQDAYTHYLSQTKGFPCKVINWGLWGEAGMASDPEKRSIVMSHGLLPTSNDEGVTAFKQIMAETGIPQLAYIKLQPVLSDALQMDGSLVNLMETSSNISHSAFDNNQFIKLAYPERIDLLTQKIRMHLSEQLQHPASEVMDDIPLNTLGMDSLLAINFRNVLTSWLSIPLPVTLVFDYPTVNAIVTYLASDVFKWENSNLSLNAENELNDEVDQLDEEGLIELLLKKIE